MAQTASHPSAALAAYALADKEREEIRFLVQQEQLSLLFRSNRSAIAPTMVAAAVFWGFVYWRSGELRALAWGVAMQLVLTLRYVYLDGFRSREGAVPVDGWWWRSFLVLLGITGGMWGFAAVLLLLPDDAVANTFVVVTILGVQSGALAWMTPVRAAVLAFSGPLLVLLVAGMLLHGDPMWRWGAVLTVIYMYATLRFALQQNGLLAESMQNRFVNARLNDKLTRANAEKSRFLAAASHDLRQPATAIAFFADALEHKLAGSSAYEDARRTKLAVRSLNQALDSMLDISRLDAGIVTPEIEPVRVQRVLRRLNETFLQQAIGKGVELRVRASELWVLSDEEQLHRMLGNIVSNAIKYTERGGVLVVARRRAGGVVLDVFDTGIGIAAAHLDKIFDEFYQVDNPGRDRNRGLGIGLAIVQRLSRLLDHPVEVTSVPDRGTRVRVWLPLSAPGVERESRTGGFRAPARLPREVLVIDDEVDIVDGVASLLAVLGVHTWKAVEPVQALDALAQAERAQRPIEVILCDVRLGRGINGMELMDALGAGGIPMPRVILMTGDTAPEDMRRLEASGFEVLPKPVTTATLLEVLSHPAPPRARQAVAVAGP